MKKLAFASAFVFAALASTAPAQAETVNCTAITTLPTIITVQGVYCFTADLATAMTSGNAIDIQTNNVVLDLNGFKLGGLGAGLGTTATGIYAYQRQNITVKNGTVRGFYYGIGLDDASPYTTSKGHVIEDIRADQNTYTGIFTSGKGNIIRNNQVVATGGTTANANGSAYGIMAFGPGAQVLNNMVTEVAANGVGSSAVGIWLFTASNSVAVGNRVGNITGGASWGIYVNVGTDLIVSDNRLSGMHTGITCSVPCKYFSNVTQGVATPFFGGTDAGLNN